MLKIVSTYTLTQYINKGEYGKVYKAINHQTSQNVAIKMIPLDKFIQNPKLTQLTKHETQTLLKMNDNPNIIKLKEIIKSNRYLYLVYQYCEGGTLEEYLKRQGRLNEKEAISMFKQLIDAYRSLYENNIVHRDIKTDNILIKENVIKLADFGFSKTLKYQDDLMQTSLGSPLYMAPEVLNNDVYSSKADLWSCAIILYQMLFGHTPYNTSNINQLLKLYSHRSQVPLPLYNLSSNLIQMLKLMLNKDQFRRISWQQFFYEYQFTQNGEIIHRQKDFEYDLMKLMKRKSSCSVEKKQKGEKSQNNKLSRFNWSKITDLNSSVHSEQCHQPQEPTTSHINYETSITSPSLFHSYKHLPTQSTTQAFFKSQSTIPLTSSNQQAILSFYNVKKTIKHFEQQHSKAYEILLIIEEMLQSKKEYESDLKVVYILVCNLSELLTINIQQIENYISDNKQVIDSLPQEKSRLQKMQRIFKSQLSTNKTKLNCIKTILLNTHSIGIEIFKYPQQNILRKVMKQFVENYQLEVGGVLDLLVNEGRDDALKLLRILWAVQLLMPEESSPEKLQRPLKPQSQRFKYTSLLSIKQETPKRQLSALINRYLVRLAI